MDVLISKLRDRFDLISTSTKPLVVNCVPGSGKSTLIRELILQDSRFVAYTGGEADFPSLTARYIRKFESEVEEDKLCILDEYQVVDPIHYSKFVVLFGDPQQAFLQRPPLANFTCIVSHRFGKNTAYYLRKSGIDVVSDKEDKFSIDYIFTGKIVGVVVAFESAVLKLLDSHNCAYLQPKDIRGCTFEKVTYVTTGTSLATCERHLAYICVTRHTEELLILSANVVNTSRGLF